MPMIDAKVTLPLDEKKREELKSAFGRAVGLLGKSESYLMVSFEDKAALYFAGKALEAGAFVSVKLFGTVDSAASDKMTGELCRILEEKLGIKGENVYITYEGFENWGWRGRNF